MPVVCSFRTGVSQTVGHDPLRGRGGGVGHDPKVWEILVRAS